MTSSRKKHSYFDQSEAKNYKESLLLITSKRQFYNPLQTTQQIQLMVSIIISWKFNDHANLYTTLVVSNPKSVLSDPCLPTMQHKLQFWSVEDKLAVKLSQDWPGLLNGTEDRDLVILTAGIYFTSCTGQQLNSFFLLYWLMDRLKKSIYLNKQEPAKAAKFIRNMGLYGLIRVDMDWSGWFGLIQIDMGWYELIPVDMGWCRLIRVDLGWLIRVDIGWYGLIQVDTG